jgi:hypothetical protein
MSSYISFSGFSRFLTRLIFNCLNPSKPIVLQNLTMLDSATSRSFAILAIGIYIIVSGFSRINPAIFFSTLCNEGYKLLIISRTLRLLSVFYSPLFLIEDSLEIFHALISGEPSPLWENRPYFRRSLLLCMYNDIMVFQTNFYYILAGSTKHNPALP